ncbi:MAG TPA: DNA/RNA non-specific endonuclease [Sphingomonas sp.]|nr:DNA/RNA non-specific endonuclease [Sphingomonas sp.]
MGTVQRPQVPVTAFSVWLRTGRRGEGAPVEVKFNPWHDREDGRFTFAGQGNYFPRGWRASNNASSDRFGGGGASGAWGRRAAPQQRFGEHDPQNPRNHSVHIVRAGDTLTRIAAQRKGLRVSDLVWLNGLDPKQPLRIGQQIKLPHQRFLDAGREAKNRFLALDYYMRTHGGLLPPDPANPPSLQSQILDTNWRRETRGTYDYWIDIIARPRKAFGVLSLGTGKRSRRNQARAGQPDRRPTDDGGHYIGVRFNAPRDAFNHFAQDANFNRGAYRVMEDGWVEALKAGRKVFVTIEPHYIGTSRRPDSVTVTWEIDGEKESQKFSNDPKGMPRGK